MKSSDLRNLKEIPRHLVWKEKYEGGVALYYEGGWYYTLYLESLRNGFETRFTLSIDLIQQEDGPEDRPIVTYDLTHNNIPIIGPNISKNIASDVKLCYFNPSWLY